MNVYDTKPCVTLNLFQCALFVLFVPKVFLHILHSYSFPGSVCKVVKHSQNVARFEKNIISRAQHCYLAFIQARRSRSRRLRRRESDAREVWVSHQERGAGVWRKVLRGQQREVWQHSEHAVRKWWFRWFIWEPGRMQCRDIFRSAWWSIMLTYHIPLEVCWSSGCWRLSEGAGAEWWTRGAWTKVQWHNEGVLHDNRVQCSAVQCGAVQCCAVHCSVV